jgi:hypothetical protein
MTGFCVLNMGRLEIVVHSGGSSIVAGIIGGAVVLIGVVLTEMLVRSRERRRRLEEAVWSLQNTMRGGLLSGNVGHLSDDELDAQYSAFAAQLTRIRAEAKWPLRDAEKIVAEVDAISTRFMVAVGRWGIGRTGPPRLAPILGERLVELVIGDQEPLYAKIDAALSAEGLPTLADVMADKAENMPLPSESPADGAG